MLNFVKRIVFKPSVFTKSKTSGITMKNSLAENKTLKFFLIYEGF